MKRFRNILFVADRELRPAGAFARAVDLAGQNGARLTVIDAQDQIPPPYLSFWQKSHPVDPIRLVREHRERALEKFVSIAKKRGVAATTRVAVGTPFIEIIRQVLRDGHDLVMKRAEGGETKRSPLFSSTGLHLLRKCPCPVWIIKSSTKRRFSRILAAVDPDPESDRPEDLNRLILDLSTSLAASEKSELHIIHAWSLYGESVLRSSRVNTPADQMKALIEQARENHRRMLDDLLSHYTLDPRRSRVHMLKGEPEDLILNMAQRKRIDLIVMGTISRTGIAGLLIGNTSEKVLGRVDCSVLTVKPRNFVTPVRLED